MASKKMIAAEATTEPKEQYLMVTTIHRGVFAGYGIKSNASEITLKKARMCVSWSSDMHGVFGLASHGPSDSCKVGPEVPELILRDVSAVLVCTSEARTAWEKGPWK